METQGHRLRLLKDAPIVGAIPVGADDPFGRRQALETVVTALDAMPTPSCVALYGPWGSGKTSLLRGVQAEWEGLAGQGRVVWFEPWLYERRDDVLTPLLHAMVTEAERKSKRKRAGLRRMAVGIAKTTLSFVARFGMAAAFGGAIWEELKGLDGVKNLKVEDAEKHFETIHTWFDEVQAVKRDFRALVDAVLRDKDPDARVLVLLDDLDRCQPDNAVGLIEGVKLLLCGCEDTRASFVFALDRQVVGESIRRRYRGSTLYTGETYLEKIFDLSLEVPPVCHRDRKEIIGVWLTEGGAEPMKERLDETFEGLESIAAVLSEPVFDNPRVIKRALNRLLLLVSDEGRAGRVKALGASDRKRLLTWVAGSERFRTFRHFVKTATDDELSGLFGGRESSATTRELLDTPGLRAYLDLLAAPAPSEFRASDGGGRPTFGDLDSLLATAGL